MKEFKFNEQNALENMFKSKFVDENNVTNTMYALAKYNCHVLYLDDEENYNQILKYITTNCPNIYEEGIYKDINGCIKSAKKHALASINEVCITESELTVIKQLDDIKQEKIAFVVLAISKYFNALSDTAYDSAFLTNGELCKIARVTIPVVDRDTFMQFAYDRGILQRHTIVGKPIKKVAFVSHDDNDKVVLHLNEGDFIDLAYTYLAYKTPQYFRRCIVCKAWIKKDSKGRQVCSRCSEEEVVQKDKLKAKNCIVCGKVFCVDTRNNSKIRCDDCQKIVDHQNKSIRNKRYYESHKDSDGVS